MLFSVVAVAPVEQNEDYQTEVTEVVLARAHMLSDVLRCLIHEEVTLDSMKSAILTRLSRSAEVVDLAKTVFGDQPSRDYTGYTVEDTTLWYFLQAVWLWECRKNCSPRQRLLHVAETNFLLTITRKWVSFSLQTATELRDSVVDLHPRFKVKNAGLGVFATRNLRKGECLYSVLHQGINMQVSRVYNRYITGI